LADLNDMFLLFIFKQIIFDIKSKQYANTY